MKRIAISAILLLAVAACTNGEPTALPLFISAPTCDPPGCASCSLHPSFYADSCPDMASWCSSDPTPCPAGLSPLFCAAQPPEEACVFVSLAVCDESNSTWCCSPDLATLGKEAYCDTPGGSANDCPKVEECLVAECVAIGGAPNPYGSAGKCSYVLAAPGTPCPGGTCQLGVCTP
jgi:hypothetical protein